MLRLKLAALAAVLAACGGPGEARVHALAEDVSPLRPTEAGALWRYDPGETVESYDSAGGGFRVHFTREGPNAVPARDADANGIPDLVSQVANVYEAVAATYHDGLGLRRPLSDERYTGDHGGDGRFDVYLVDFAGNSDGSFQADGCLAENEDLCYGHIVQENDFAGYGYPSAVVATRILGSHEYFHAVQDAYDAAQGVVFSEGMATWGSEYFDPSLNDLDWFVGRYLETPERSLDVPPPGPVPSFAYGAAIFFQFLSERFEPALLRTLLEHLENGQGLAGEGADPLDPYWTTQLELLLARDHASSFAAAFLEFARWNLYTGAAADPAVAYASGANYGPVAMTGVDLPFTDPRLRLFYASAQYYAADPGSRDRLVAEIIDAPDTEEDETKDVALILAVKRGGRWSAAEASDGSRLELEVGLADEVVVAVVNTALSGGSRRPALCFGDPAEVQACREALAPPAGEDGGTPDAGLDAGTGGGGGEVPGCGCAAGSGSGVLALLLPLASVLTRRRRGA